MHLIGSHSKALDRLTIALLTLEIPFFGVSFNHVSNYLQQSADLDVQHSFFIVGHELDSQA
ncbi:hypothetical protein EMIT093MI4_50244 [Pseudomonas sp. IT-93MI4]